MKLYIANRVASLKGNTDVLYENGATAFSVEGKVVSLHRKKRIYDAQGNLLYLVKNRLINLFSHKAFIEDAQGNRICAVKDKFLNMKQEYSSSGSPQYKTEGGFFGREVRLLRDGQPIGMIRRNVGVFADRYELETDAPEVAFLTAFVIAIDNIRDDRKR